MTGTLLLGSLIKTIDYTLNIGERTTITSAATPPTIAVSAYDVVRYRGTNASYATSKSALTFTVRAGAGRAGDMRKLR